MKYPKRPYFLQPTDRWMVCTGLALALLSSVSQAQQSDVGNDPAEADSGSELEMLIVAPESTDEPEAELPNGTGVSGKTMATTPGSAGDPLNTLQAMPGLAYSSDDEPTPAVRGSRPDDNLFLVDFLPVDYLFHAGGLISVLNPDLVESFTIYPSGYGPEFAGVTGGAFDIRLRDPKKDRFHTKLDVSLFQAGFLFEGPVKDDQSFYLAGRISYLDLLLGDQLEDEEEDITIVQFPKYKDYQAKYVWDATDDVSVRLQANGATDDLEIILGENADGVKNDPILAGRLLDASSYDQQGVTVDANLSQGMQLKTAVAHSAGKTRFQIGNAGDLDFAFDSWMSKSQIMFTLGENHDITLGAQIARDQFNLDLEFSAALCTEFETDCNFTEAEKLATSLDKTVLSTQVFLKDSWYVNDRLTLFPGVVLLHEDWIGKTQVEPRLALEFALNDDLLFNAGAGVYHQMPSFEQFDDTFGNPDIDYIESTHAVVGLQKEFGNGWSAKSELYYKDLQNLVTGDDEKNYANNGEGSTLGIDTLIRKDLTDRFSGWLSLTVAESTRTHRITGESFDFEYDQPVNATLVASWKITEKWNIGAKFWAHSGALYTPVTGATADSDNPELFIPTYGPINSERFPTYKRLDVRLDRTVRRQSGKTFSTYFEILNVLDSENVSSYDYNADYTERTKSTQIPLFAAIGFKAEF